MNTLQIILESKITWFLAWALGALLVGLLFNTVLKWLGKMLGGPELPVTVPVDHKEGDSDSETVDKKKKDHDSGGHEGHSHAATPVHRPWWKAGPLFLLKWAVIGFALFFAMVFFYALVIKGTEQGAIAAEQAKDPGNWIWDFRAITKGTGNPEDVQWPADANVQMTDGLVYVKITYLDERDGKADTLTWYGDSGVGTWDHLGEHGRCTLNVGSDKKRLSGSYSTPRGEYVFVLKHKQRKPPGWELRR